MFQSIAVYISGDEVINMPEAWSEVTFNQYVELVNRDSGDWFDRISVLTGLSIEDVKRFKTDLFVQFVNRASFLNDTKPLMDSLIVPEKWQGFKVGSTEIGTFMQVQQELDRVKEAELNSVNAGAKIVKLFTGEDIGSDPVTEVLGLVNFFLLKLESS